MDRETQLRGQCLVSNEFGTNLRSFRVIFYNSSAPAFQLANSSHSSNSSSEPAGEAGDSSWDLTTEDNTALIRDIESRMADSLDFEEDDVEEFQMEKIIELRKEEERKERKRIRERDKVHTIIIIVIKSKSKKVKEKSKDKTPD